MQRSSTNTSTLSTTMRPTMTREDWPGDEWRCVLEGGMGQCVMTTGTMKMPLSSAINWDSPLMVRIYPLYPFSLIRTLNCMYLCTNE